MMHNSTANFNFTAKPDFKYFTHYKNHVASMKSLYDNIQYSNYHDIYTILASSRSGENVLNMGGCQLMYKCDDMHF